MSHLQLLSLGTPLLITEAGAQIRFRTRKHFALLIRLATESGKKFTRDYLMDLLWPDAPAPRARHSLAQALTVLKDQVGREHLDVQRATVALAEDAVVADVRQLGAGDVQIRGPFLDGFDVPGAAPFEQWKDEWRAKLMPRIRDCLVAQMDAGRRTGDYASVQRHAQVLLDLDPLSEDAVRGLMEARAWVGDRSNALKIYGRFETRLAEELGAQPSPDLARIAGLLREGRRSPAPGAAPMTVSERRERRFEAETLIGREREFAQLYDAWLDARRRAARIVVVMGDPGVGKTTLVNAFVSTCQMDGAVVARAQAYEAERELPFAVLAELVKQLTLQRAIGAADPEALSELSRVSPQIFEAFPGVPKPVDWSAEVIPLRLADSLLKAVEAAAEESPLVLVVDDIHAADNATAAILHIVARKLPPARLLLILTARANELRTAPAPSALVSDTTIEAARTLELEPLPREAGSRLVAAVAASAGAADGDVPTERILEAANGNPLAVELLTKEWVAHGTGSLLSDLEALNTQPAANVGIPRAIGAVFERQVARLTAPERAALDLAAVLGRRLADLPLYEVVDLSPPAAGAALARLRDEGFLREIHGGLEFRNELIRAQAYYVVAGPAREHLHRRVGEVLASRLFQSSSGHSTQLEVAWHFLRGSDFSRAWTFAMPGAAVAICVGAPYEAEQILYRLLRHSPADNSGVEVRLLFAKALMEQSKADRAMPSLMQVLEDPRASPSQLAEAAAMRAAAEFLLNLEPGAHLCESADLALEAARKTGDPQLIAKALFQYARSGLLAGDGNRLHVAQRQLQRMAVDAEQHLGLPLVLQTLAYCNQLACDVWSAAATHERAFALGTDHANPSETIMSLLSYAFCQYALCDFKAARLTYLEALALSKKIGDDYRASVVCSRLCALETARANYAEAIEWGCKSTEYGKRAVHQPDFALSWINLADAYMLTSRTSEAVACWKEAHAWMGRERNWQLRVAYLLECASFALMSRNTSQALQLVAAAEHASQGKESAFCDPSMFAKYRVFRIAHTTGNEAAWPVAAEAKERFRERHPIYYLNAVGAMAWLERRKVGQYSPETRQELGIFDALGAPGRRALLQAQGFLE